MGSESEIFRVNMNKKESISAALPLQEHWLQLSNLDLLLPPVDVGVFFCYNSNNSKKKMSFGSMVSVLKNSLAQVLVSYYAFAGEVVSNSAGEPEILCNNRGVDFFEAFADVCLRDVDFHDPDYSVEGKLVPKKKDGVLAVQATEMKCGGVVVGCTFDHRIADAYSTNMFLVAWAEIAQSKQISLLPSFRRSLLNPRRVDVDYSLDNMYIPVSQLKPDINITPDDEDYLISRIYYVKVDQLNHLQSLATPKNSPKPRTKLESFCALLWQLVAKSAKRDDYSYTKMGIVVDGRSRLGGESAAMDAYFGNVLSIPYGGRKIEELTENSISWVAQEVHNFLETAVTKEHFLGLIDWVEAHRPEPALAKIYSSGNEDGPAFVVSSGQRFPVEKVDFGWGVPVFGSYHFPWGGRAGYVMPMPSPSGNGDWVVYMHLLRSQMEYIETEASSIFKPLTSDYLKLI
ncbi:coniferyl alcohol acyltransferase [Euphorbia lathyris]|uniref:coniferyl alcohol acyltransferase n=1 Tax=Euphorbia lathyris TaxID=212925 RepID=UPI003091DFCD|nr:BAHD10 [Euphorbia lathyris]